MATVAVSVKAAISERRFHVWMAAVFVVMVFCGFGLNFAMGRVRATLPPLVRFHGMAFSGWILLYLVQCVLVDRGSVAVHRRLGWFGAVLSMVIVPLGIVTTIMAIRRALCPPHVDRQGQPPATSRNPLVPARRDRVRRGRSQ